MSRPDSRIIVLAKKPVFQGYFQIDRYQLQHQLHNGGWSQPLSREVFERGHIGAVLPFDPLRREVVLIEQFRPGAYAAQLEPWLMECVAGVIEIGEDAEQLVLREAIEEAGCKITELTHIYTYLSSPGACSETVALFCGRTDTENIGGIHGLESEGEDIKVKCYSLEQALQLLDDGFIVNAKTIIAMQWLRLNHNQLIAEWQTET